MDELSPIGNSASSDPGWGYDGLRPASARSACSYGGVTDKRLAIAPILITRLWEWDGALWHESRYLWGRAASELSAPFLRHCLLRLSLGLQGGGDVTRALGVGRKRLDCKTWRQRDDWPARQAPFPMTVGARSSCIGRLHGPGATTELWEWSVQSWEERDLEGMELPLLDYDSRWPMIPLRQSQWLFSGVESTAQTRSGSGTGRFGENEEPIGIAPSTSHRPRYELRQRASRHHGDVWRRRPVKYGV